MTIGPSAHEFPTSADSKRELLRMNSPIVWAFALMVGTLLIRTLLIPDAIVMSDEYYYAKLSERLYEGSRWPAHITNMPGRGESDLPNSLFFFIYQIVYFFGDNFYVAAKLLNVLFSAAMAFSVARVAHLFVGRVTAAGIGCLVLWLPASTYYVYFMTEPLYECLLWIGILTFLTALPDRPLRAFGMLGAFLGAALLAKPNAAAVIAAANCVAISLWVLSIKRPRFMALLREMVVLNVAFVATAYIINVLVTGHLVWDPVGGFYRDGLHKISEVSAAGDYLRQLTKYTLLYLMVVTALYGPCVAALLRINNFRQLPQREIALVTFAVVGVLFLLLGSVKAGVAWERTYDGHSGVFSSRYMAALFPLLLVCLCRFPPKPSLRTSPFRAVVLTSLLLFIAATGIAFSTLGNPLQMRELYWFRMLDVPTQRVFFLSQLAVLFAVSAYFCFARRPIVNLYLALIALLSVIATMCSTYIDVIDAREGAARSYANAARGVKAIVPEPLWSRGIVVSDSNRFASQFMFRVPAVVPFITVNDVNEKGPSVLAGYAWQVFLGDQRASIAHLASGCLEFAEATLCVPGKVFQQKATRE